MNELKSIEKELIKELKYFSVYNSDITNAEKLALDIAKNYSVCTLCKILLDISVQHTFYPNMQIGICKIFKRFELEEVKPYGLSIITQLLMYNDDTIKECIISVIENWSAVEFLPALKRLKCSSPWLKSYNDSVIEYLEGLVQQ